MKPTPICPVKHHQRSRNTGASQGPAFAGYQLGCDALDLYKRCKASTKPEHHNTKHPKTNEASKLTTFHIEKPSSEAKKGNMEMSHVCSSISVNTGARTMIKIQQCTLRAKKRLQGATKWVLSTALDMPEIDTFFLILRKSDSMFIEDKSHMFKTFASHCLNIIVGEVMAGW